MSHQLFLSRRIRKKKKKVFCTWFFSNTLRNTRNIFSNGISTNDRTKMSDLLNFMRMTNTRVPIVTRILIVTRVGGQGPPRYPCPALRPDVHRDYYNDLHRYSPTALNVYATTLPTLVYFFSINPLGKVLITSKVNCECSCIYERRKIWIYKKFICKIYIYRKINIL